MDLFFVLLVLLLLARALAEIAVRIGQPALVGELLAGVFLGLLLTQAPDTFPNLQGLADDPVFKALTDLGIFFLMLFGGLELLPEDLREESGLSLAVALSAMVVPLGLGAGLAWLFLPDSSLKGAQAMFVGTGLAITAVPVAVKVLLDMDLLKSRLGKVVVAAAVIDDVVSLILLAFLTGLIRAGSALDLGTIGVLLGKVALFFLASGVVGLILLPRLGAFVQKHVKVDELEFTFLLVVALALSVLAEALSLHFIVGAFLAGLFFRRRTITEGVFRDVKERVSGLTHGFLAPLFFVSIGLHLDLAAFGAVPVFVVALILAAFLSKLAGAGIPARLGGFGWRESAALGVAMSARGAVELILAGIALRAGLFELPQPQPPVVEHLFSSIVIVAIVTTMAVPVGLRLFFRGPEPATQK